MSASDLLSTYCVTHLRCATGDIAVPTWFITKTPSPVVREKSAKTLKNTVAGCENRQHIVAHIVKNKDRLNISTNTPWCLKIEPSTNMGLMPKYIAGSLIVDVLKPSQRYSCAGKCECQSWLFLWYATRRKLVEAMDNPIIRMMMIHMTSSLSAYLSKKKSGRSFRGRYHWSGVLLTKWKTYTFARGTGNQMHGTSETSLLGLWAWRIHFKRRPRQIIVDMIYSGIRAP
jgi:hypothetical protein